MNQIQHPGEVGIWKDKTTFQPVKNSSFWKVRKLWFCWQYPFLFWLPDFPKLFLDLSNGSSSLSWSWAANWTNRWLCQLMSSGANFSENPLLSSSRWLPKEIGSLDGLALRTVGSRQDRSETKWTKGQPALRLAILVVFLDELAINENSVS